MRKLIILALSIFLVGCGISKDDYEALKNECEVLKEENDIAESRIAELEADYEELQTKYDAALRDNAILTVIDSGKEPPIIPDGYREITLAIDEIDHVREVPAWSDGTYYIVWAQKGLGWYIYDKRDQTNIPYTESQVYKDAIEGKE